MLSATAHTFNQKARLAVSLAWIGGFVDAVGFIVLAGIFTSNMTGNTALLAGGIARWDAASAIRVAFPVLMFFLGAILSGVITTIGQRRRVKPIYSFALGLEVILLIAFVILGSKLPAGIGPRYYLMLALPALAMGLQNATVTQIAGAVVRTTHITGVLTDLGLESVQLAYWFRDQTRGPLLQRIYRAFFISSRHPSFQRLLLLLCIYSSFLIGAVLGVWLYSHRELGVRVLLAPVAFLVFLVVLDLMRPIADVDEIDHRRKQDPELTRFGIDSEMLPPNVAVYRIRGAETGIRRAPDLARLAERIGREASVLILLFDEHVDVDDNNFAGLTGVIPQLNQDGCQLVLSTSSQSLYRKFVSSPVTEVLNPANICPDPEFAVARALELASVDAT